MSNTNVMLLMVFILSILTTLILSILILFKKSTKYNIKLIIEKIKKINLPVCIIDAHVNEIIDYNDLFYKKFIDNKIDLKEKFSVDLIFKNFQDYLDIKKIIKNKSINESNKIIKLKSDDDYPKFANVYFSYFRIGFKKFIFAIFSDITYELEAYKKLGLFSSIMEYTPDGLLISKLNSNNVPIIVYANSKITEITGYDKNDIIGKPINNIFELNVEEKDLEIINNSIISKKSDELEYKYTNKNGKVHWLHTNIMPIDNDTIEHSLRTIVDNDSDIFSYVKTLDKDNIFITMHKKDITHFKEFELNSKELSEKLNKIIKNKTKYYEMILDVFYILISKTKKYEAIHNALEIIGKNINADRGVIYSLYEKDDKLYFSAEYEWLKDLNIESVLDNPKLNNISFEDINAYEIYAALINNKTYSINLNEIKDKIRGKFFELDGSKSKIIQPIYKDNKPIKFICFDDCNNPDRKWDPNIEIALSLIAKSLAIILEKRK
jgi:PAS domain S-box-containing protein